MMCWGATGNGVSTMGPKELPQGGQLRELIEMVVET